VEGCTSTLKPERGARDKLRVIALSLTSASIRAHHTLNKEQQG